MADRPGRLSRRAFTRLGPIYVVAEKATDLITADPAATLGPAAARRAEHT